ncbi:glutamate receptor 3,4 [Rhizoctonia solani]|uniref:Glutamate receptor 3,4 n=1 Tax=Rhizoctonia solani TaxID=456999 RepID=A0A8H8P6R9_9AGAM|nr:glutamate receptor 3,4 [Rhizoctonia solani]QRW26195.1 glutamate receptor 3,4 [Rhizoctonia solani]
MSDSELDPAELAMMKVFFAKQGFELWSKKLSAANSLHTANQTSTNSTFLLVTREKPVAQGIGSLKAKLADLASGSISTHGPQPATSTKLAVVTEPATMTKVVTAKKPAVVTKPLAKPTACLLAPNSLFWPSRPTLIAVPSPKSKSTKLLCPRLRLKYMKKPKGTAGRKGKHQWPEPMQSIFGTTNAEYLFIYASPLSYIIKLDTTTCLTKQEGDSVMWVIQKTYKFLPKFKIYKGDWPVQAFLQIILKSSTNTHQKLTQNLTADPGAMPIDGQMIVNLANCIVDANLGEEEGVAKGNKTMVTIADELFGMANGNFNLVSEHKFHFIACHLSITKYRYVTLEPLSDRSDSDDNEIANLLPTLLPLEISGSSLGCRLAPGSLVPPITTSMAGQACQPNDAWAPAPLRRAAPPNSPTPPVTKQVKPRPRPPPEDSKPELMPDLVPQTEGSAPQPMPVHTPTPTPTRMSTLEPGSQPNSQPGPKLPKKQNIIALTLGTQLTRARTAAQPKPKPKPAKSKLQPPTKSKPKDKTRSKKAPMPKPKPNSEPKSESTPKIDLSPLPKNGKKRKVETKGKVIPSVPTGKGIGKRTAGPRMGSVQLETVTKLACKQKAAVATSSQTKLCQAPKTKPKSKSELSQALASKSNPPQPSSDAEEAVEYKDEDKEESQPAPKGKKKKLNKQTKEPIVKNKHIYIVQPGKVRDPPTTAAAICSQYDAAFTHTAELYITSAQRAIGVKDCIAQPIIRWIQA